MILYTIHFNRSNDPATQGTVFVIEFFLKVDQEKAQDLTLGIPLDHLDENKEEPDADNA